MDMPTFDELFKQINANFWILGIKFNDKLGIVFQIQYFMLFTIISAEICYFVYRISSENFLELTALAPCTGIGLLALAKMLCIALDRRKIYKLYNSLNQLYQETTKDREKEGVIRNEIIFVKTLTKFFFILNTILIIIYNFSTLVLMAYYYYGKDEVVYGVPYAILLPFAMDTWQVWIVVYTYSVVAGFICVLYFATADALYYNLASHVCNNFTVLSYEIEHLTPAKVHTLNDIVKRHQYILKLSEDLEEIFTAPNLYNVLIGSIEICALGFNIMAGDWAGIPGFVFFLISELVQILVMSLFGENLIRESRKVGESAFLCEWYNMDQKSKKHILYIMTRANKPQRLTAYKFSIICYESFTKIIGTSWSYFTILKTVYTSAEVIPDEGDNVI